MRTISYSLLLIALTLPAISACQSNGEALKTPADTQPRPAIDEVNSRPPPPINRTGSVLDH